MSLFTLKVITPGGVFYQGDVTQVIVPATEGPMGILPHHASIIASLIRGEIDIQISESDNKTLAIQSGYVKMTDNVCMILAVF
ncbi:FoF1 ATP synthase subunit delta/epsilon [Candidatus Finniella inopinata]|uniref:F0F1 ATP synthase subunit epsilon n=1 Tax=Candidatus Finniella inopinata TaxID=1696036 RepID=A0A4Q7DJT8_9PROT|nr:F0F1 ATP synthase subunit epsilon [Candidatus Finniella inopinata]RZI46539.1 F0F1 ATP synthase subunit epsilon [Candidatus Finniella inopinata]